jgi:uncharacterized protein YdgA (DUF945 family)
MRVIGYVEHPALKITVFKMDLRISIQFEQDKYIQTYRFTEHPLVNNLESAQRWVTAAILADVQAIFAQMHRAQLAATHAMQPESEDQWDEVV